MRCPKCGSIQIMVTDTRHLPAAIRRRRKCLDCDHRWTTLEISAETVLAGRAMMDEWDKRAELGLLPPGGTIPAEFADRGGEE